MMSTHKLTAGDGYVYLIRQTAAHDAEKRGRPTLGDYYTEKGETPRRWVGRGLSAFGEPTSRALLTDLENTLWRIEAGSQVTEDQMKALFGLGLHPNAGAIAEYLISMGASAMPPPKTLSALAVRSSSTTHPQSCNGAWLWPTATTT